MIFFGMIAMSIGQMCLPVTPLYSEKGFYIGTKNQSGEPYTRESVEYYQTQLLAIKALSENTWTQRVIFSFVAF